MQTISESPADHLADKNAGADDVPAEDVMRAALYRTLSVILGQPPREKELALLSGLKCDDSPLGAALSNLSKRSSQVNPEQLEEEFGNLFIGVGRGELVPHASYYLTGFLNEKPLVRLRSDLRDLRLQKDPEVSEPEDHISTLLEIMAGLILGEYDNKATLEDQHRFYTTHVASWASHFFNDLEKAKTSDFYMPVGTVGRLFLEVEDRAFSMA